MDRNLRQFDEEVTPTPAVSKSAIDGKPRRGPRGKSRPEGKRICRVSVTRLAMMRGGSKGQLSAKVQLVRKSLAIWLPGAGQPIDNQTSRDKNSSTTL